MSTAETQRRKVFFPEENPLRLGVVAGRHWITVLQGYVPPQRRNGAERFPKKLAASLASSR